jgi:hypothetical protein
MTIYHFRVKIVMRSYGIYSESQFSVTLHSLGVCSVKLTEWLERLTPNAKVATVLGSIPGSLLTQWNLRGDK